MNLDNKQRRLLVGITGASGTIYAERLIERCLPYFERIYLVATDAALAVAKHELKACQGFSLLRVFNKQMTDAEKEKIRVFASDDLFAPVASGTACASDMIVVPCSMGTMARIATGMASNLLERAADVCLKERRRLVIVPRESPFNRIHLQNMLSLDQMGAHIVPPMPAFYQNPKSMDDLIDFVVGKLLESLQLTHEIYRPWNSRML